MQNHIPSRYSTIKFFVLIALAPFIFINISVHAQESQLSGKTVNADTKLPLAFVSIGIRGKAIGTVSDSLGQYRLSYRPDEILKT
ncbi:MAG: hypothetical protein EOO20_27425, partial [Chryseobacterium sp.]